MTIDDFEDLRVGNHLSTSGLLSGFTDINGNLKAEPVLYFSEIDLTALQANQRAVLIRQTGQITNPSTEIFYDEYNYIISIFSRVGPDDSGISKGYAKQIRQWLRANPKDSSQCIIDLYTSGVVGPYITDEGRRVYEVPITVKFSIDIPTFS